MLRGQRTPGIRARLGIAISLIANPMPTTGKPLHHRPCLSSYVVEEQTVAERASPTIREVPYHSRPAAVLLRQNVVISWQRTHYETASKYRLEHTSHLQMQRRYGTLHHTTHGQVLLNGREDRRTTSTLLTNQRRLEVRGETERRILYLYLYIYIHYI